MKFRNALYSGVATGRIGILLAVALVMLCFPLQVSASEGASGWGVWETAGRFFNLGIVVAALIFILRKPLVQFFEERRMNIRRSLEEAQQARRAAEAKLAEIEKRMAGLDLEVQQIMERAAREAEEEGRNARLLAEQESERIIGVARREAEALLRAATIQLRQEAAKLAVELAEKKIHAELGDEMDSRLVETFVRQLSKSR